MPSRFKPFGVPMRAYAARFENADNFSEKKLQKRQKFFTETLDKNKMCAIM